MHNQSGGRHNASAMYRLRIRGHIDRQWQEWLGNMQVTNNADGSSTLSGELPDQAALYGVISRLRDLGLTLLSVEHAGTRTEEVSDATDA